jgi:MerR family transcriptional regulator, light-induced transcriptional regulator
MYNVCVNEMQTGLTIKMVAERTGVSVHTLRAWERRYGLPKPNRGVNNRYRLYDEQDIADVLWMKKQVEAGIPPAQASMMLEQQRRPVARGIVEFRQPTPGIPSALRAALIDANEFAVRRLLDDAFATFTPEEVALEMIQPAMQEIGKRWLRNELSVWREHLASNLVRQKLLAVLQSQPALPSSAPHLIAACAPGEEHELGLLTVSLLAQRQGWRVAYLGFATPLAGIADLARISKPKLVLISVTTVIGLTGLMPWLIKTNRPAVPLVFGGRMPMLLPALREHLPGAYLGDDAFTVARELTSFKPSQSLWSPSKRVWNAAQMLTANRHKVAEDTTAQFIAKMPAGMRRKWQASDLNAATLFLIDALISSFVFDVPEMMDMEKAWLKEAMPLRQVPSQLIRLHVETIGRMIEKTLGAARAKGFRPLIERLVNHAWLRGGS